MAAVIPFDRDFEPPYAAVERLAPGLRRVTARNGGPFTFRGTGTYIVGDGAVAVIDPGPDLPEHVDALLKALDGETVSHIVITHTHLDHSPAAKALKAATGAPTYGYGPHGAGKRERGVTVEAGGDMDFVPDVVVRDGDTVEGRGWRLQALHTPGHTSNHLCFRWADTNQLFSGDHVMGWSTSVISPPDGDMGDYMASLDRLLGRPEGLYWPTHGPAIRAPETFVRGFIAHRREREDQLLACLKDGVGRIDQMVPRVYADVAPALHAAAARSLYATVIHLVETGRAACDGEPTVDAAYRLSQA